MEFILIYSIFAISIGIMFVLYVWMPYLNAAEKYTPDDHLVTIPILGSIVAGIIATAVAPFMVPIILKEDYRKQFIMTMLKAKS